MSRQLAVAILVEVPDSTSPGMLSRIISERLRGIPTVRAVAIDVHTDPDVLFPQENQ